MEVIRLERRFLATWVVTIAILAVLPARADETDRSDTQGWIEYQYRQRINDKLQGSWSLGYRELISAADRLSEWSRSHLRGDIVYSYSEHFSFEAGLGGYYTSVKELGNLFEFRTWQGTLVRWPLVKMPKRQFALRHRLRLEQRWLDESGTSGTEFGLRLRYRLGTGIPLNSSTIEAKTLYLPLGGELFYDIGDETAELLATRVRLGTGLGYVLSDNWALEFRYMVQRSRDTILDQFTITDHIIDLRIRTTLRIRDLGTPW